MPEACTNTCQVFNARQLFGVFPLEAILCQCLYQTCILEIRAGQVETEENEKRDS